MQAHHRWQPGPAGGPGRRPASQTPPGMTRAATMVDSLNLADHTTMLDLGSTCPTVLLSHSNHGEDHSIRGLCTPAETLNAQRHGETSRTANRLSRETLSPGAPPSAASGTQQSAAKRPQSAPRAGCCPAPGNAHPHQQLELRALRCRCSCRFGGEVCIFNASTAPHHLDTPN